MGSMIGTVISFARTQKLGGEISVLESDPGGGAIVSPQHYADCGDDSQPLITDYLVMVPGPKTGTWICIGYLDPINQGIAATGEKRIYSRDSSGQIVAETHHKNTGEIVSKNAVASSTMSPAGGIKGSNPNGSFELEPSGNFLVNGVTIDTSGNITGPGSITAPTVSGTTSLQGAGKEMVGHPHLAGTPPGNTGPNL